MSDGNGEELKPPAPNAERTEISKEQKFDQAINEGINLGLSTVKERFENPDKPKDNLDFHNPDHSRGVVKRVEDILTAIHKVNPNLVARRDIQLGKLIAAHHDTVQDWEEKQVPDQKAEGKIKRIRQRKIGDNEKASATQLKQYMNKVNKEQNEEVFTHHDMEISDEAIMLTVPNFDTKKGTVTQPGFGEKSIIAQALALADLGTHGRGNLENSLYDTVSLLTEENLDIAALDEESIRKMPSGDQNWYKGRIVGWFKSQPRFMEGRKAQSAEDIATMHPDARKALEGFFPNFDANIEGAKKFAEEESAKPLPELIRDIQNILNPPTKETEAMSVAGKIDLGDPDESVKVIVNNS